MEPKDGKLYMAHAASAHKALPAEMMTEPWEVLADYLRHTYARELGIPYEEIEPATQELLEEISRRLDHYNDYEATVCSEMFQLLAHNIPYDAALVNLSVQERLRKAFDAGGPCGYEIQFGVRIKDEVSGDFLLTTPSAVAFVGYVAARKEYDPGGERFWGRYELMTMCEDSSAGDKEMLDKVLYGKGRPFIP